MLTARTPMYWTPGEVKFRSKVKEPSGCTVVLPITLPPTITSINSPGKPRPRSCSASPTSKALWEISNAGGMRVGVAVTTGAGVGVGVSVAAGGATINCNGVRATTAPSAANDCTVTPYLPGSPNGAVTVQVPWALTVVVATSVSATNTCNWLSG